MGNSTCVLKVDDNPTLTSKLLVKRQRQFTGSRNDKSFKDVTAETRVNSISCLA